MDLVEPNYDYQPGPDMSFVEKWSWGAAGLGWIWGIGNRNYMPLLSFIPGFSLFWWIVCGIFGRRWAWETGTFDSYEQYVAIQKSWDRAGLTLFALHMLVVIGCILLLIGLFSFLSSLIAL